MNAMFYFFLALTAVLAATASPGKPVFDFKGNLILDGSYYVFPYITTPIGGGLTLASRGSHQCPLYIGLERIEQYMGIPVRFSNWESSVGFVPQSENLNIEMDIKATTCVQSTYWYVSAPVSPFNASLIAAGPKPNFFQIEEAAETVRGYKIKYCPDNNDCTDVGVLTDESGGLRLALNPTSLELKVMFIRASEEETSSKLKSII